MLSKSIVAKLQILDILYASTTLGEVVTFKRISEEVLYVPVSTLRTLVRELISAGIVKGRVGRYGGFWFNREYNVRNFKDISVQEVDEIDHFISTMKAPSTALTTLLGAMVSNTTPTCVWDVGALPALEAHIDAPTRKRVSKKVKGATAKE